MRILPLAVVVSAVVHATVVVWLATRSAQGATRGALAAPAATPIEVVPVARAVAPAPALDVALDVALIDDRAIAPLPIAAPSRRPAGAAADARAVVERPPGATATAADARDRAPPANPAPGRNRLLAMRHGGAPSAALPFGRWDSLDHAPRGTSPERPRSSGELHDAGRGGYASDQGGFTARVSPDGSIALTDSPSFDPHLALPSPRAIGRAVASWYESEKGTFGEGGDTSADKQLQLSAGPSVGQSSPEHTTTAIIPVIGGKLEITDWLMRRHGQDPYASRKLELLDATRDERVRIGDRHRAEQLALTPQIVRRNLDAMWAATPELRARKRALFELWDECVETGDAGALAAGEAARQAVIGFIRGHLPAGSAEAYTPAELAELARGRRSKAAFVPYE